MGAVKTSFEISLTGNFFGVVFNEKGPNFAKSLKNSLPSRRELLRDMTQLMKNRVDTRIDILKKNYRAGVPGVKGAAAYQAFPHGKHKRHKQRPYILTDIIDEGMSYKVKTSLGNLTLDVRPYRTRNAKLNFHKKMSKVPTTEKVWQRLNETCLPFEDTGLMEKIGQKWLENTRRAFNRDLKAYIENRNQGFLHSKDKSKAGD